MSANDNDPAMQNGALLMSHGHGPASLLLVESLIHGLCENETLSTGEAVAITERAAEVQRDYAEAADGAGAPLWRSHALLSNIAASLRADHNEVRPPHLTS